MAGKGTYGAYKQAEAVGTAFGDNLDQTERAGFHYRREEQEAKDRKSKRMKEQADALGVTLDQLAIPESGIRDIDAPAYDYIQRTTDKLTELSKKIAENPDDMESRILYNKYENSAKHLKGFVEKFSSYQLDYQKGLKDGVYSKELNKGIPEGISQSLQQGRYKILNDKNGDLQLFVDMDGDGVNDNQFQTVNVREFLSGNALYAPKKAYDSYGVQDKIAGRFGTVETKEDRNGHKTVTYKGFDPKKKDQLIEEVNNTLGTYDNMTDAAKSILSDKLGKNLSDVDEKGFNEFREDFAQDIINTFEQTDKNEIDYAGKASDAASNRANVRLNNELEDRKTDKETKKGTFLEQAKDEKDKPITTTLNGDKGHVLTFPKGTAPEIEGGKGHRLELYKDGSIGLVVQTETKTTSEDDDGNDVEKIDYDYKVITDKNKLSVAFRGYKDPETGKEFKNLNEIYYYGKNQLYSKELQGLEDIPQAEIDAIE